MNDHLYFLSSILLRKGDTIDAGHWVTIAFPEKDNAILYDDHIVEVYSSDTILKRSDVMKKVTILFYTKGHRDEPHREKYLINDADSWKVDSRWVRETERVWRQEKRNNISIGLQFKT